MQIIAEERDSTLVFHGLKCGMRFENIAVVGDWKGHNPLVMIPEPLGRNAVILILDELKRLRGE